MTHRLTNPQQIKSFLVAGNATFTLESLKTTKHYTFRARKAKQKKNDSRQPPIFVSLLTAPEQYTYLGCLYGNRHTLQYTKTKKSRESSLHTVLAWFVDNLNREQLHQQLVFRHEGRCGRCGRELTTPESIDTGLGPVCADKLGVPHVRHQ